MKKILPGILVLSLIILVLGIIFVGTKKANNNNVNDFYFSNFVGEYYLSKNSSGRSQLRVVETFVAEFPEYNQNKGIVRAIPVIYQNHPQEFELVSVTRNGKVEPVYKQYREDGLMVIKLGTDDYVYGKQEYKITYKIQDVTEALGSADRFNWDFINYQLSHKIDNSKAVVYLAPEIQKNFTGELYCHIGRSILAIENTCESEYDAEKGTATFRALRPVQSREYALYGLYFNKETFSPFIWTSSQIFIKKYLFYIVSACMVLLGILFLVVSNMYNRFKYGPEKPIIPQPSLPKDISVMEAGRVIESDIGTIITAQIIDLAIKRKIRIIEYKNPEPVGPVVLYSIELINNDNLLDGERDFLRVLLGTKIGSVYSFNKKDYIKGKTLKRVIYNLEHKLVRRRQYSEHIYGIIAGSIIPFLFVAMFLVKKFYVDPLKNIVGSSKDEELMIIVMSAAIIIMIFFVLVTRMKDYTFTKKGLEVKSHINSLKAFLGLSKKDHSTFVQGPEEVLGASIMDVNNETELYESLLPYAILFSLYKNWNDTLKEVDYDAWRAWFNGERELNKDMSTFIWGLDSAIKQNLFRSRLLTGGVNRNVVAGTGGMPGGSGRGGGGRIGGR